MTQADQFDLSKEGSSRGSCLFTTVVVLALVATLATIAVLAVYVFLPLLQRKTGPEALRHRSVGQELPRLELQPLTGDAEAVSLPDLAGKVALINFWGTWCPPCVQELPDIAALEKKYRGRADVRFLAVSCGRGMTEDPGELAISTAALLDISGIDMPTYADPDQTSRRAFDEVGRFEGYPTTLILDRGGVIRGVWEGIVAPEELEALITQLLDE